MPFSLLALPSRPPFVLLLCRFLPSEDAEVVESGWIIDTIINLVVERA
jgi:hypothetical protein